jgi:hypothetical protein
LIMGTPDVTTDRLAIRELVTTRINRSTNPG